MQRTFPNIDSFIHCHNCEILLRVVIRQFFLTIISQKMCFVSEYVEKITNYCALLLSNVQKGKFSCVRNTNFLCSLKYPPPVK